MLVKLLIKTCIQKFCFVDYTFGFVWYDFTAADFVFIFLFIINKFEKFFGKVFKSINAHMIMKKWYQGKSETFFCKVLVCKWLLLLFENPNGYEIWKLTSKCIQTNANIIYKHLDKYFHPLECECLIRR